MRGFFTILLMAQIFASCNKDEIIFIPNQTFEVNRDALIASITETPPVYSIVMNEDNQVFITPDSIIVDIPGQSLTDSEGHFVTGEIKMEFKEFSGKKSNFLNGPSDIENNSILNVSKLLYISFSKNDKSLQIVKNIDIYLPSPNQKQNFNIFKGVLSDNDITWLNTNSNSPPVQVDEWLFNYQGKDISIHGFKIQVSGNNNWYCVANRPENANIITKICLQTSSAYTLENTLVYWISDDNNSVLRLNSESTKSVFCTKNITIEQEKKGKIIMISDLGNERYFFGMTNAIINENPTEISLNPLPKSIKEIKEALNAL